MRDAGVTRGNKREYKMQDLIATTARRLEPRVILSK